MGRNGVNVPWGVPNSRQEQAQPTIWSVANNCQNWKKEGDGCLQWGELGLKSQMSEVESCRFREAKGEEDGEEERRWRGRKRREGRRGGDCRGRAVKLLPFFAVLMRREKKRAGLERREDGEVLKWWFGIFNSSPRWMVLGKRAYIGVEDNKVHLHAESKSTAAGCDERTKGAGKVGQHAGQQFTHHGSIWQRHGD